MSEISSSSAVFISSTVTAQAKIVHGFLLEVWAKVSKKE